MSKTKNSSKVINWIAGGALAYFVGTAIAGAIKRKRESTNGIGYTQGYASRKRILSYFDYPELINAVSIDTTVRKGKYVDAVIYFKYRMPAGFWISPEDARWLSELCDRCDVEFDVWNGNEHIPTLHKKIVWDVETDTQRLPRI